MSLDSISTNVSIQLENWLEKHSRSYPRRWQKRYFRFDGDVLSYSKSDSSSEKFKVNISDIIDVKMKSNVEGRNILLINIKPDDGGNVGENELEILMPNTQILKIWYNSIKECVDSANKLKGFKAISSCSINKSGSITTSEINLKSNEELRSNINKPLPQPNLHRKENSTSSNIEKDNKSLENINKKSNSEKSSVLNKLDALLGDLQHTMSLSEVERKSVIILNSYERIGLSPLSNTLESSPLKQNYSIDSLNIESNSKEISNIDCDKSALTIDTDDKKIKTNSMPPTSGKSPEKFSIKTELNISDPALSASTNKSFNSFMTGNTPINNRKNTIVNAIAPSERENDELISDINKKINLNLHTDGMGSKSNSCVYNMAVNNYKEGECDSRNNSGNFDNYNIIINTKLVNGMTTPKSNHSSNSICSPVINKPKQLEIYTQFENSLTSSLDIVNIVIQILDISNNNIEMCYTDYKEVILTKSSDLINKSSSLFKQINDETRQRSSISISENTIITKNPQMIEYGNELASTIRKIVSSLKIYLKIVKKDQLIQASEYDIKSMINSEIETNKKTTINELKQSLNDLKNILITIQNEFNKVEIN